MYEYVSGAWIKGSETSGIEAPLVYGYNYYAFFYGFVP